MKNTDLQGFARAAILFRKFGDMEPMADIIIAHALAMNPGPSGINFYTEPTTLMPVWEVEELTDLDLLRTFGAMCVEAGATAQAGRPQPSHIELYFDRYAYEIDRRLEVHSDEQDR